MYKILTAGIVASALLSPICAKAGVIRSMLRVLPRTLITAFLATLLASKTLQAQQDVLQYSNPAILEDWSDSRAVQGAIYKARAISFKKTRPFPKLTEGTEKIACSGRVVDTVRITYLGVGGVLMRRGSDAIMTAPFYSNPSLKQVGFWQIKSSRNLIDRFLPPVADVKAILVGHSHYDHLMDVPYIARVKAPQALIYGNNTMTHILAAPKAGIARARTVGLDGSMGAWVTIPGTRIRIMPLRSEHAPHFFGIKLYQGEVPEDLSELPKTAYGWLEGQTLAFLIDFLDQDGRPEFRIHYQDSASNPPWGFPPAQELASKGVDLDVLCVASFQQVNKYPQGIIGWNKPARVLMAHWEDFFTPQTEPLAPVPQTDVPKFVDRVSRLLSFEPRWNLPAPGAELNFEICR